MRAVEVALDGYAGAGVSDDGCLKSTVQRRGRSRRKRLRVVGYRAEERDEGVPEVPGFSCEESSP